MKQSYGHDDRLGSDMMIFIILSLCGVVLRPILPSRSLA